MKINNDLEPPLNNDEVELTIKVIMSAKQSASIVREAERASKLFNNIMCGANGGDDG